MAKYLVETYYTCSFKVNHYLDELNEKKLSELESRDDGKFEIIDIKLDNRKTRNLDKISKDTKVNDKEISTTLENSNSKINLSKNLKATNQNFINKVSDGVSKRFSMPDRRKGYIQKASVGDHKVYGSLARIGSRIIRPSRPQSRDVYKVSTPGSRPVLTCTNDTFAHQEAFRALKRRSTLC